MGRGSDHVTGSTVATQDVEPRAERPGSPAGSCEYSAFPGKRRLIVCHGFTHKFILLMAKLLNMASMTCIHFPEPSLTSSLCSKGASVKGTQQGTFIKGRKTDVIKMLW